MKRNLRIQVEYEEKNQDLKIRVEYEELERNWKKITR